jgi:hypothetical protein
LWGLPLMLATAGAIHACDWLLHSSGVSLQRVLRHSILTVAVTFGCGVGLTLVLWVFGRLVRFPRTSAPRELEASSFFLSR